MEAGIQSIIGCSEVPMSDPLATYMNDHLAGSAYAIDLVEFIRDRYEGQELGQFAGWLLIEIEADREFLKGLAERAGGGSSKVKELTAWLGEKVSRLKLGHAANNGLGLFEALEFLEIGIHGKLELWRALAAVAPGNPRLRGVDFEHLANRAEKQREEVESRRLRVAHFVFGADELRQRAQSRDVFPRSRKGKAGSYTPLAIGLAFAVVGAVALGPDLVRYMKIRAM
jgi:hypothetical protein